jgi:hypothetical protein
MMARIDLNIVRAQIAALLAEYPELADDEDLRRDTIEGETDAFELLALVLGDIRDAQAMQTAISERVTELRTRQSRFERREEFSRKLAVRIMDAAALRKAVLPEATLSIRPGAAAVRITAEGFIPAQFWRVKREIDVSAIKSALKAGTEVPGAVLSNGSDNLAILVK